MRKLCALLVTLVACSLLQADVRVLDEIVAKVNGDIITRSELDKSQRQMETELRERGGRGPDLQSQLQARSKDTLRDRIDQLLLVQRAKELNISVDSEVTKYLADLQRQSKIADPDKFRQLVLEQTGMPFEDYKAQIRDQMLTQRVVGQEVVSRVQIPRADLEKYYNDHKTEFVRQEQVFLRELFLSTENKTAAEKATLEKKAKDLVARARKGEKFHELARDNSDAVTAKQGGELPGFKPGELDPELEKLVFTQAKGHVTEPISRGNGFLILKVEEHTKAGQATFEEAEYQVRDMIMRGRMEPAVREFLTKLRENAFLEIREGYVDSGAAPNKDTKWKDPAQLKPETVSKEEVANQKRRKKLLGMVPIPGTASTPAKKTVETGSSSSKTLK